MANQYRNEQYDIIVIGGGLSGMTAAYKIANADANLDILLIEATDKLGGRKHSMNENNFAFSSNKNKLLIDLLEKLGIPMIRRCILGQTLADLNGHLLYSNEEVPIFGGRSECAKLKAFFAKIDTLIEKVSFNNPHALVECDSLAKSSMEQFICENLSEEVSRNFVRNIVHSSCGLEAKDISTLFFLVYCNSSNGITNQYSNTPDGSSSNIIEGGVTRICNAIKELNMFSINFKEKVISVDRKTYSTHVNTSKEQYKCSHVLVALSSRNILNIKFTPDFTDIRIQVLKNMIRADLYGVVLTFEKDMFTNKNISGDVFCNKILLRSLNISSFKKNSIFGLLKGVNHSIHSIMGNFGKYVGDFTAPAEIQAQFLCKSLNIPDGSSLKNLNEIRRPLSRVFWGGHDTSTVWYGDLEGAVQSGIRAAIELIYDLRPQALTVADIVTLTGKKNVVVSPYKDNEPGNTWKYLILLTIIGGMAITVITKMSRK